MKQFKRIIALTTLVSVLSSTTLVFAEDNALKEVFVDACYGGAIGVLVGGAIMAFQKKPADHFNFVGYGAASGVLAGTTYGLAKSARAFAELENGRIKMAFPTIMPEPKATPSGHTVIGWRTEIFRGTFN